MATKKEVWFNYHDGECKSEFDALTDDLMFGSDSESACETGMMSNRIIAAIDALHEYAHRGEGDAKAPDTSSGTVQPEGVPPELDDWVKRWEWITARVTEADCEKLNEADEIRVGLNWFPVRYRGTLIVCLKTSEFGEVAFSFAELAAIANEVRYNGR